MEIELKVTTIGNSAGIILPKELLAELSLKKGDTLYATSTPDGIHLTPYNAEFAEQIRIAQQIMRKNRNALRKLAE